MRVRQGKENFQYKESKEGYHNFHASGADNASDALDALFNTFDLDKGSLLKTLSGQLAPNDGKMEDIIGLGKDGKRKVMVESAGVRVQVASYKTDEGFTYHIFSVSHLPPIVGVRCQLDDEGESTD